MTNESKVVAWRWRSPHMIATNEPPNVTGDEALIAKVNGQGWEVEGLVTHADYRALEDENRSLRASFDEAHELWVKAAEELASIKARVGGIEKKDPDLCDREYANGWNACRLALEASK